MIKVIKALVLVLIVTSCSNKNTTDVSIITGIYDLPYKKEITLSKIEYGKEFLVTTTKLNDKKEFSLAVSPENEGLYILGDRDVKIPLYLKNNQIFEINYDAKGYDMTKIPDEENATLYKWEKSIDTLKNFDFRTTQKTYKDFFPFYEKFIPEMQNYHEQVKTSNKKFNQLMHAYIDLRIEKEALNFVYTPRSIHPERKDYPLFYNDFMIGANFDSALVLDLPDAISTLKSHQMFKAMNTGADFKTKDYMTEMFTGIQNDTVKSLLVLEFLRGHKTYNKQYLDFVEPFRDIIALSDYAVNVVDEFEVGIKTMAVGSQGYEFTYKDINGKDVSFSDFKGKYVYIDAWATWCAPCKKEIPYIKQLEKDLHGKDIVFVSISMDKPKDKEKWEKFVKKEELTGIQLMTENAFDTRIARDYKINSIPRFFLFDKEGKIISADADRPSNPALKKQLLELLN